MPAPDVTVSIVNHSNRDAVLGCLDALSNTVDFRHSVEVAVLDNASEDGSVEAIRARHPSVKLIAQRHRDGFGANHNSVLRATDSRYVLFLNDDSVAEPAAVDELADFLDANPDAGAVGPRVNGPDGGQQHTAWRARTPLRALLFALTLAQVGYVQSTGSEPRETEVLSGIALMVRREALDEVGAFDERFFMYCEDEDLSRRLRAAGYRLFYLPATTIMHYEGLSSVEVPDHKVNEVWRSLELLMAKHHGRVQGRIVLLAIGTARAAIGTITWAVRLLPARLRPQRSAHWYPRGNFIEAANAWRGVRGQGLRELAEGWNAAQRASDGA